MAMRVSDKERTPEFSRSVIFTTSDIKAGDAEVLILLFIRFLLICKMVVICVQSVSCRLLRHKYILMKTFDTVEWS